MCALRYLLLEKARRLGSFREGIGTSACWICACDGLGYITLTSPLIRYLGSRKDE